MRSLTLVVCTLSFWLTLNAGAQQPTPPLTADEESRVNDALQGMHDAAAGVQRMLLFHVAHDVLAAEARAFAETIGWGRSASGESGGQRFEGDDPRLPASIRVLHPSSLRVWQDRMEIEFGGALHHQGISVFRNATGGKGTKELAKGVWYYSEGDRMFDGPPPKI